MQMTTQQGAAYRPRGASAMETVLQGAYMVMPPPPQGAPVMETVPPLGLDMVALTAPQGRPLTHPQWAVAPMPVQEPSGMTVASAPLQAQTGMMGQRRCCLPALP